MARYMSEEGLTLSRVYGLNVGHRYTPEAKVQIEAIIDSIAAKGRNAWPREIHFETWTLRYDRMRWVRIEGLEKHWERARVDAAIEGDHALRAKTVNVSAVSFEMGTAANLLNPASKVSVLLDGQNPVRRVR